MKVFSIRLFIFALTLLTAGAFAQNGPLSRISVKGNTFVATDGKVVVFRGLDTSDPNKLSKENHWNKEYFVAMKSWGANIVRFPVHPSAWRSQGKDAYVKLLDQGIAWAGEMGMYVIIDWHSIGNLRTEMYQNDMYETTQKETFEFWRTMARQYKDNPTVAFLNCSMSLPLSMDSWEHVPGLNGKNWLKR